MDIWLAEQLIGVKLCTTVNHSLPYVSQASPNGWPKIKNTCQKPV